MKNFIRFRAAAFLLLFLSFLTLCGGNGKVKYVFLFIGDGMSYPQRQVSEEFAKVTGRGGLFINSMPVSGATITRAANNFITDSAASGTAIACGEKTNNGMLGVTPDGSRLVSVAEVAHKAGRKVGIITSVTINHATPGAFYAHRKNRSMYHEIGKDLVASNFEYFGGGGVAKYKNNTSDIYADAAKAGYTVARGKKAIRALKTGKGKILASVVPGYMTYALDKSKDDIRLAELVRQAIAHCDNEKGFFIMTEGGAIDAFGHANDAAGAIHETLEFDDAVKAAYEFYKKHPQETLIVVTGDHETGGMTLGFAGTAYSSFIKLLQHQKRSIFGIWKQLAELDKQGKLKDWESAKKFITKVSGLEFAGLKKPKHGTLKLTAAEEEKLQSLFEKCVLKKKKSIHYQFPQEIVRLVNNKASVGWTTGAHTALPVNTTALGKYQELFSNMYDNTDIAKKLKNLVR